MTITETAYRATDENIMFLKQRYYLKVCRSSYRDRLPVNLGSLLASMHVGPVLDQSARVEAARNHYQLLGVERDATKKEIRDAFVALSKKYHPDSNLDPHSGAIGDSRAFVKIAEAYHTLSNPKRRARYDSELMVAETYRTQYEQRFYRGSTGGNAQPFKSQGTGEYSHYSTGGGHSYQYYDQSQVDWELHEKSVKKPRHARVVYMLLALTVIVPTLFMLRVNHNYRKYYKPAAILESQRNLAAYRAVRDRARSSSVQDQLDLLVRRHSENVEMPSDININGPSNR